MWQRLCGHCTSTVDFIAVWGESRLSYGQFEKSAKTFVEVCNISVVLTVFTPNFPAFYFDFTTYSIFLLSFLFWLMLFQPYCFADTFFLTLWSTLQALSVRLASINEICFARLLLWASCRPPLLHITVLGLFLKRLLMPIGLVGVDPTIWLQTSLHQRVIVQLTMGHLQLRRVR